MSEPDVKLFTPREADQTLPLVRRIVEDILEAGRRIREVSIEAGAGAEQDPRVIDLVTQLEALFDELEAIGCSYRDWNFRAGLVDFPAVIDGRSVLLCWRSDEPSVRHYHDLEAGFAGRQPIPEQYLS